MPYTSNKKSTELETKTPPIDADVVILGDSADLGRAKGLTWANVKATLKTYFDTLYQTILVSGTSIKTINSTSLLGSGDITVPIVTDDQLKIATVTLTSAEIKALHTTPKVLVAAPGAGKITVVDEVIISFTFVTPAYTGSSAVYVRYTGLTDGLVADDTGGIFNSGTNFIVSKYPQSTTAVPNTILTGGTNKDVNILFGGASSTGNGTAKVFIKYRIITL